MPISKPLYDLYKQDKEERLNVGKTNPEKEALAKHTRERITQLKTMLPTIDTLEIWNCHYIAYLFQHSEHKEDYKLAHQYAKKAVDMGSKVTRWLYAATLDRYLLANGKPQKFGTQFILNKDNIWELYLPIDETVTDEERTSFGVPPLEQALEMFQKKYTKTL